MTQVQEHLVALSCLLATIPSIVTAGGFANLGKHEALRGHLIVEIGDFERISPPSGRFGGLDVLKLGINCYQSMGLLDLWGLDKKAGLIVVDSAKSVKIALIESGAREIKIEVVPVIQVRCPATESDGLPQDPQQRQQELARRLVELQKEIERILQGKH